MLCHAKKGAAPECFILLDNRKSEVINKMEPLTARFRGYTKEVAFKYRGWENFVCISGGSEVNDTLVHGY